VSELCVVLVAQHLSVAPMIKSYIGLDHTVGAKCRNLG
jgi:hypothetical protein